ncbi:MAG: hypothetical protein LBH90_04355 [Tannerella sp.]|jgi:hypothetical protein|nr:hypothetical protein [Tannerella sp.]
MKNEVLYNSFLEKITQKIPHQAEAAHILANMLFITKEKAHKKLRREDSFTFDEIITISGQLGISLDRLKTDNAPAVKPFGSKLVEYLNPAELDFALLEALAIILKPLRDVPNAFGGEITNVLPRPLYMTCESIFKFDLFRWKYQSNNSHEIVPYKDIVIMDKLRMQLEKTVKYAKNIHTDYIFDNQIFHYLVTDVKYFYFAGLLSDEEVRQIKEDLLKILHKIDCLSQTGFFNETGKKINIYLSNVKINTSYIYINAPDYQLAIVKAFLLNGIASIDEKTFKILNSKLQAIKRQSVLITGSGEKERIKFLKEQRRFIEDLSKL